VGELVAVDLGVDLGAYRRRDVARDAQMLAGLPRRSS
jgi:hypothetical protein